MSASISETDSDLEGRANDAKTKQTRRSKRTEAKKERTPASAASSKSTKRSIQNSGQTKHTIIDLKKIIADCFEVELRAPDVTFIEDLYSALPCLYETWDRIGFNKDTKESRLVNFYQNLKVNPSQSNLCFAVHLNKGKKFYFI